MPLSDEDYNQHSTYFGVWSAAQSARVSELLDGLGVRYEFLIEEQSEERLREWIAWDSTASKPTDGYDLFIHSDDLEKVGTQIVELYPERKFGAA
jgi:hypothetical protein